MRCALSGLLICCLAPVAARAQVPKPAAGVPYQTWTVLDVDGGARTVYVRNDSPSAITIAQVSIDRCENTRQLCGQYSANKEIAPGKTEKIFKIERDDARLSWSYAYSLRAKVPPPAGAPTASHPQVTTMYRAPDGTAQMAQLLPVGVIVTAVGPAPDGNCLQAPAPPGLPSGHKVLTMIFGTDTHPGTRVVQLWLDEKGNPYEYLDSRTDTVATANERNGPYTAVRIDLSLQHATIRNVVGGQTQWLQANGAEVLTAASLGNPGGTIDRMKKECGQ